ncbi:MAG: hypothetical protein UT23_C0005G0004 [Candidatus Woesebacteria bacterium GW2011_GWA1_39_12]|uniref:Uncharacterized protein n=1 Tax=Candidatus Woesebacteria bacterium GW2011_GWA1_39_12 TaxID=1618549 RepID=A0A0G0Q8Q5_9BACT|nr:MAG: hypothetical protein UT23_C0005G0004 [Candidatus Woesebacteria bacterium GW2011_GWA1_39_12]
MKKLLIFEVSVICLFIFSSLFVTVFLVRNRLDTQYFGERFVKIEKPFRFSFTPNHDNINILIIPLKNPGLINKSEFNLRIFSEDNIIREINFSGYNVGDPSDVKFQFEPITNTKNEDLDIEISSDDYQNPILINTDNNRPSFRAYYRSINKKEIIDEWANAWGKRFINNFAFFVTWFLLLTITVRIAWSEKK